MRKQIVLVMGATCSGKGHLCDQLLKIGLDFVHLSVGERLGHEIRAGSPISDVIKKYRDAGKLVPDNIINDFTFNLLSDLKERPLIFLDGFPRTFGQLPVLKIGHLKRVKFKVIFIDTPLDICHERALKLRQRDDDHPDALDEKFADFQKTTKPMIDDLLSTHQSIIVDGRRTDHFVLKIIETLDLEDFINLERVSQEVIEKMQLWRFGSIANRHF